MRKVLIEFMTSYATITPSPEKSKDKGYNERRHRRKAIKSMAIQLSMIRDAEEAYMDNIPENLRNSSRYTAAEQTLELLEEALELLREAYA
jgi:hypothetical protein